MERMVLIGKAIWQAMVLIWKAMVVIVKAIYEYHAVL